MLRIKTLRMIGLTPFISLSPAFPFWQLPSRYIDAKRDINNVDIQIVRSSHNLFGGK